MSGTAHLAATTVGIVVVSYKSAALTVDCLRSIAAERAGPGPRIRCVVIDNASGDEPVVAAAIADNGWSDWARVVVAPRNGGFAYGNNLGLRELEREGRVDFVHLLNPDTVLRPGAVAALADHLQANPRAGIAGGVFENGDGSEWAIAFRFPSLLGEIEQGVRLGLVSRLLARACVPMHMGASAAPADWVSGASMMVKREVFDRIGGLDETFFLYFEETEFCHRARRAGYEVWYVPASRVVHIAGQSTKVTERNAGPRRLPAYWFDSRRLYFTLTRGPVYAACADALAIAAGWAGLAKSALLGRLHGHVPHFLRDLFRHSALSGNAGAPHAAPPRFDEARGTQ
ncbi:MAG: glycosyltransferase family 2 protein [Burkholderiales bacterium]|nr:glycosyltransferase family 2 protein [Burkholderiales bacterium]